MISRTDALRYVLDRVGPLPTATVRADEALGRVLAEDVVALRPVPPFANSAMDGVAVRAADTSDGSRLQLVGTVAAGSSTDREVGAGEAMRIMTGAPMPPGADAVVMVELCTFDGEGADESVTVGATVPVGNHVRPVGDDIAPGVVVLDAGAVVTAGGVALLRTLGRTTVPVVPAPVVGVLSTGDELVEPPAELGAGQIYDSNRAALLAMVGEAGCTAVDLGLIRDDEDAIEAALVAGAARCDAVITSGGVSMGDYDYVKAVLDRIGDMSWMQVAIKPAKPLAFGTLTVRSRTVPVFGLPGNPVSSMVSFELFARPGLRKMSGHREVERPLLAATAAHDLRRRPDGKLHYVRVALEVAADGTLVARSAGGQGSHHLAAMASATGLVVLDDGDGVSAGERVRVLVFGNVT